MKSREINVIRFTKAAMQMKRSSAPTMKDVMEIEDGITDDDFIPTETVSSSPAHDDNNDSARTLEDTERETIKKSLERNCGRRKKTAEELNISERTLYRKIKEYGLE